MSHVEVGPLSAYSSLTDRNLTGYFTNTRMRRHLRKSGLITKRGEIVSENTYRLNMARKEHKKHVKNMLAQAIVHKTLDLERSRQSEIRKKLEEIAKIELVRRVRSDRHRHLEDAILPYLAPKSAKTRTKSSKRRTSSHSPSGKANGQLARAEIRESNGKISAVQERASREKKRENYVLPLVSPKAGSRPSSSSTYSDLKSKGRYRPVRPKSTPSRKKQRPMSALSSNYDDENENVVYLDDEGRPISPSHVDESELKYSSKDPIDTRHLYSLDTTALRKYAMLMAQVEQGKDGIASPYLVPQVPIPPKSPHHGGTPRSAHRYRSTVDAARLQSPKRPTTADQAYLHPSASAKQFRGQQESMCEVFMIYHGQALSLAREQFDKRQDIVVEQQHCGGNTLTVFRDKMEPNTEFSFISYRHCGYPFALSIYIDGKIDCRISTCCEYRHAKGKRIAGKKGHFGFKTITGAKPCYKCQVEKGIRVKSAAPRRKLKRPPNQQEEVVVVETNREEPEQKPLDNEGYVEQLEEEILVPVDHVEEEKKYGDESEAADDYDDDDFEDSDPEEAYVYSGVNTTSERGNEDGADSDRRSQKEAENIIKIANKIVEESAIKESKDGRQADERGSRLKKDPRKVSHDEDIDEESLSSCKSDEDYYEYKKRMMKKMKEQEMKQKAKKAKQKAVNNTDDNLTESGSRRQHQDDDNQRSQADQVGRKKSSTSSAMGQAEPVNSRPAKRQNLGARTTKHRKKGAADAKSSSDGNATADEVSDIESEMAASPRKTEAEKGFINFQPKEARGVDKTTGRVDIHDVSEGDDNEDDEDWEEFIQEPYSKLLSTNDEEDGRKTSLGQRKGVEEEKEEETNPSPRPSSPLPTLLEFKEENKQRRDSVSSASSSSPSASSISSREGGSSDDYSDSKEEKKESEKEEENVVVAMGRDQRDSGSEEQAVEIPIGSTEGDSGQDGGYEKTKPIETAVEEDEYIPMRTLAPVPVLMVESRKATEDVSRASSSSVSSSSSSSGSAMIQDQGPNTVNDPTMSMADEKPEQKEEKKESDDEEEQVVSMAVVPLTSVNETVETPQMPSEEPKEDQKSSSDSSLSSEESKDSSSDSDSDSESQEPRKEDKYVNKDSIVETQAEVHVQESLPISRGIDDTESDPEATYGGNDPDNVANDNVITVARTIDPVPMGMAREGSVLSLLEANRNAVEIKGVTLNKPQVYEVAEFLEKSNKLNSVTLVNCGIDDDDVQKLMEAMRNSPSNPVMVNLCLNPLTAASVTHILQTVKVKTGIEAVLLQGTRLGDHGVTTLVDGILAQYDDNKNDPEMKDKGLHELDLTDCKFGDEGATSISALLKSDVDIDTITLSHNHAVSLDGWRYIGDTLRETRNLETLTLDHNFIGDEGMEAITRGLQENTTLTALDINDVGITDKGARCIMDMLKKNTTLLEILMMENEISDSIAENIQKYISLNKASYSQ